jgi:hypothetical protein
MEIVRSGQAIQPRSRLLVAQAKQGRPCPVFDAKHVPRLGMRTIPDELRASEVSFCSRVSETWTW